ncbi:hypothetical protein L1987_55474 [Smallanthus sonchifolius]|uniref:Uncharacterized protein n=1 Tax=Smallanthus sonchifolius TaxID=185202 RepID=A0ACB9EAR0_9ASTR|nr:hypothetical protein L1987_55474 [Smallanthus sonchifolius]
MGQWRSLGHVLYCLKEWEGPILNGHVHWIVRDEEASEMICTLILTEYGIKKSWHKEEIISPLPEWVVWEQAYLLEYLKDGTILMVYCEDMLLECYWNIVLGRK